jgi:hypothetical protein
MDRTARIVAGFIAVLGIAAIIARFFISWELVGSPLGGIWSMLRFFTVIGNILAAVVMAGFALNARWAHKPAMLGCATLNIALIGVVYALLLRGLQHLTGEALIIDYVMHYTMPPLIVIFWLAFAPRGLRSIDPFHWALLPLGYFGYAIIRAQLGGAYPYPFINVDKLGWPQVLINAAAIALGFLAAGMVLVWIDRKLPRARAR